MGALDLVAIASPGAYLFWGGAKWIYPRVAVVCAVAVMAAIAGVAGGGWDGEVYADGGADARKQAAVSASDETTTPDYTRRILRALADDDANKWVRYWQARYACDTTAYARDGDNPPLDRFLLAITTSICAQLEARFGVNPAAYSPHGEDRTVGLLLNEPGMAAGYLLFTGDWSRDVFLIDPLGRVAHAWRLDDEPFTKAKMLDDGNLLVFMWRGVYEFDPRGNIVWQYRIRGLHHDVLKMPNGNVLLLVRGYKTREEASAAGANPEFVHEEGLEYDYLVEVRPAGASGGEVVWEWSVWDHLVHDFDPSKPNYGAIAEHPELIDINFLLEAMSKRRPDDARDWLHTNSIDYNPALDQIMLSPRNFSELWIIDHSADTEEARGHSGGNSGMGGDLLYRWGNPRAYGQGDANDQRLFWQHHTHWIVPGLPGAGNILVFNNGNEFPGYERLYSSVDEIVPPVDGYRYRRAEGAAYPPDGLSWTYAAVPPADFYAHIMSGTQRLPNGNTLVVDGPAGTIFQATPDGATAWKYIVPQRYDISISLLQDAGAPARLASGTPDSPSPGSAPVHRAHWYPPDHPGLQSLDLAPGAYLEDAPDPLNWARDALLAGGALSRGEGILSPSKPVRLGLGGLQYPRES